MNDVMYTNVEVSFSKKETPDLLGPIIIRGFRIISTDSTYMSLSSFSLLGKMIVVLVVLVLLVWVLVLMVVVVVVVIGVR